MTLYYVYTFSMFIFQNKRIIRICRNLIIRNLYYKISILRKISFRKSASGRIIKLWYYRASVPEPVRIASVV